MPRPRVLAILAVVLLGTAIGAAAEPAADPATVVHQAMAEAGSVPAQALTLARLAWGPPPPSDPAVAAFARNELVGFGGNAIVALRSVLLKVPPAAQIEVVQSFVQAQSAVLGPVSLDYLPAMEEAAWYGTAEARTVAITQLAKYRYVHAVLTIIDAAYEMPALVPDCIDALGQIGDERARFFLEKQMQEGKGAIPARAAAALSRIGGKALLPLKAGLRSDRRQVREAAAQAFIAVAGPEDASALHQYVADHPGDDAATVHAVEQAAVMLEKIQEAKDAAESSSADSAKTP